MYRLITLFASEHTVRSTLPAYNGKNKLIVLNRLRMIVDWTFDLKTSTAAGLDLVLSHSEDKC
jgi:hypothetical protein